MDWIWPVLGFGLIGLIVLASLKLGRKPIDNPGWGGEGGGGTRFGAFGQMLGIRSTQRRRWQRREAGVRPQPAADSVVGRVLSRPRKDSSGVRPS